MSLTTKDDGKKWIQTSVAITCLILVYVLFSFFNQMSEWFELESKIPYYLGLSQAIPVLISLGVFVYIMKNEKTNNFLAEVYQEAIKVVWPDKNETVKHTIGIMIGVTIVGFILWVFDVLAGYLLSLIQ
jgi:preprotein translocase subunit SecE